VISLGDWRVHIDNSHFCPPTEPPLTAIPAKQGDADSQILRCLTRQLEYTWPMVRNLSFAALASWDERSSLALLF